MCHSVAAHDARKKMAKSSLGDPEKQGKTHLVGAELLKSQLPLKTVYHPTDQYYTEPQLVAAYPQKRREDLGLLYGQGDRSSATHLQLYIPPCLHLPQPGLHPHLASFGRQQCVRTGQEPLQGLPHLLPIEPQGRQGIPADHLRLDTLALPVLVGLAGDVGHYRRQALDRVPRLRPKEVRAQLPQQPARPLNPPPYRLPFQRVSLR